MSTVPDEFRYLLDTSHYRPKTPSAALRAVEGGYLPEAAFIFQGVNVRPAFEEPYDLMELERLLAKPDLEFDSTLLLMQVFEKLIKNPDKELALFAAESINAIEVRRVHRIQALKKIVETDPTLEVRRELVEQFIELGRLSFNRPVLKTFYLEEARQLLEADADPPWESLLAIFLEMGQLGDAETLLNRLIEVDRQNPRLYLGMARVKFIQGDYLQVMTLLAFLNDANLAEAQGLYRFWMGEDEHG
jgi:tetratricopeptide (TPR) repeat protein